MDSVVLAIVQGPIPCSARVRRAARAGHIGAPTHRLYVDSVVLATVQEPSPCSARPQAPGRFSVEGSGAPACQRSCTGPWPRSLSLLCHQGVKSPSACEGSCKTHPPPSSSALPHGLPNCVQRACRAPDQALSPTRPSRTERAPSLRRGRRRRTCTSATWCPSSSRRGCSARSRCRWSSRSRMTRRRCGGARAAPCGAGAAAAPGRATPHVLQACAATGSASVRRDRRCAGGGARWRSASTCVRMHACRRPEPPQAQA